MGKPKNKQKGGLNIPRLLKKGIQNDKPTGKAPSGAKLKGKGRGKQMGGCSQGKADVDKGPKRETIWGGWAQKHG